MHPSTLVKLGLLGLASTLACAGCVADASPSGEDPGRTEEPIINGTPVPVDLLGSPKLSVGCSSSILAPTWLLTAHHCLTNEVVTTGGTPVNAFSVTATMSDGSTAVGLEVFLHPTADVALLELAAPINTAPAYQSRLIWNQGASTLLGRSIYCQGWGDNTFTGGFGNQLLSYNATPFWAVDGQGYRVAPNSSGQIGWLGDSGSSCYLWDGDQYWLTGVQSSCASQTNSSGQTTAVTGCYSSSSDMFGEWAACMMSDGIWFENTRCIHFVRR